jgi:hypothetical protein
MLYRLLILLALVSSGCDGTSTTDETNGQDAALYVDEGLPTLDQGGTDADSPVADAAAVDMGEEPTGDAATPAVDSEVSPPDMEVMMVDDVGTVPVADAEITAPDASPLTGQIPTSCGAEGQGLMPVDCTRAGDEDAQCVFSNHCLCSDGFECESETMWPGTSECDPGSVCIPAQPERVGSEATSCGSPDQGLDPVNCTELGDEDAFCVFSNHCSCSARFICEGSGTPGECAAGQRCEPVP